MKRVYVDVETTGLDPKNCAIIQLSGLIEVGESYESTLEPFNFLLCPHDGAVVNDKALEVNGVTRETLATYPRADAGYRGFKALLKHVDKFDKSDKYHFIGYNASFDMDFVRQLFERNGDRYFGSYFFFPPLDVMILAAQQLEEIRGSLPNFKLATVADHFGLKFSEADLHDAMADIKLTRDLFMKISLSAKG